MFSPIRVLDARRWTFFCALFYAFLGAPFCVDAARAQSIGIMPFERVQNAPKLNTTFTDDIEIFNGGNVPVQVSTSVQDWSLSLDGKKVYAEVGSSPQSLGAILKLNPTDFSIPPRKSQRVRYSIQVPAAMKGELRSMIFFLTRPLPVAGQGVRINIATKLGCSLFLLPPKNIAVASQPKINEIKVVNGKTPGDKSQVVVSVENSGLSSTRLSGTIEARNGLGAIVARGTLPRTQLLSGGAREITAQWQTALPPGDYTFKAVLDSGVGKLVAGELRATLSAPTEAVVAPLTAAPLAAPTKKIKETSKTEARR